MASLLLPAPPPRPTTSSRSPRCTRRPTAPTGMTTPAGSRARLRERGADSRHLRHDRRQRDGRPQRGRLPSVGVCGEDAGRSSIQTGAERPPRMGGHDVLLAADHPKVRQARPFPQREALLQRPVQHGPRAVAQPRVRRPDGHAPHGDRAARRRRQLHDALGQQPERHAADADRPTLQPEASSRAAASCGSTPTRSRARCPRSRPVDQLAGTLDLSGNRRWHHA